MPREPTAKPAAAAPPETAAGAAPALPPPRPIWFWILLAACAGMTLSLLTSDNPLLFHVLIELCGIVLAAAVFTIGWNARHMVKSPLLLILATGLLAVGGVDLLHTLAYQGMGIFPAAGSNLVDPVVGRGPRRGGGAFFLAALHLGQPLRHSAWLWLWGFLGVTSALVLSIWPLQLFPVCFIEGQGLTTFKLASEFATMVLLAGAAGSALVAA